MNSLTKKKLNEYAELLSRHLDQTKDITHQNLYLLFLEMLANIDICYKQDLVNIAKQGDIYEQHYNNKPTN